MMLQPLMSSRWTMTTMSTIMPIRTTITTGVERMGRRSSRSRGSMATAFQPHRLIAWYRRVLVGWGWNVEETNSSGSDRSIEYYWKEHHGTTMLTVPPITATYYQVVVLSIASLHVFASDSQYQLFTKWDLSYYSTYILYCTVRTIKPLLLVLLSWAELIKEMRLSMETMCCWSSI